MKRSKRSIKKSLRPVQGPSMRLILRAGHRLTSQRTLPSITVKMSLRSSNSKALKISTKVALSPVISQAVATQQLWQQVSHRSTCSLSNLRTLITPMSKMTAPTLRHLSLKSKAFQTLGRVLEPNTPQCRVWRRNNKASTQVNKKSKTKPASKILIISCIQSRAMQMKMTRAQGSIMSWVNKSIALNNWCREKIHLFSQIDKRMILKNKCRSWTNKSFNSEKSRRCRLINLNSIMNNKWKSRVKTLPIRFFKRFSRITLRFLRKKNLRKGFRGSRKSFKLPRISRRIIRSSKFQNKKVIQLLCSGQKFKLLNRLLKSEFWTRKFKIREHL